MAESRLTSPVNWCTTQSEIIPITFRWNISNFSYHIKKVGHKVNSSTFSSEDNRFKSKWYLQAYPKGNTKESEDYLSLYLMFEPDSTETANVIFQLFILSQNAEKSFNGGKTELREFSTSGLSWGWTKFISRQRLLDKSNELVHDDTLTIYCEIKLATESTNNTGKTTSLTGISDTPKIPDCRFGDDFSKLFDTEFLSDGILMVSGKQFKIHKAVLAARSSVFAAMFQFEMKGRNLDVIEIRDVSHDTMYNLLQFIYSGKAPEGTSMKLICDLLVAADKYDLERLKIMCGKIIAPQLTIETATELLILADTHNAKELKEVAINFINTYMVAVKKVDTWKSLVQNYPSLMDEVLEYHLWYDHDKEHE